MVVRVWGQGLGFGQFVNEDRQGAVLRGSRLLR